MRPLLQTACHQSPVEAAYKPSLPCIQDPVLVQPAPGVPSLRVGTAVMVYLANRSAENVPWLAYGANADWPE